MSGNVPSEGQRSFGRALQEYLQALDMKQAMLAKKLGGETNSQSTVHNWVNHRRYPLRGTVIKIARIFDEYATERGYYQTKGHKLYGRDIGHIIVDLLASCGFEAASTQKNQLWDKLVSPSENDKILRVGMAECAPLFMAGRGLASDLAKSVLAFIGFKPRIVDMGTWSNLFAGIDGSLNAPQQAVDITGPIVAWHPRALTKYLFSEPIGLSMRHLIVAPKAVEELFLDGGRVTGQGTVSCSMPLFEKLTILKGFDGVNEMYAEMRDIAPVQHPASILTDATFEKALDVMKALCFDYRSFDKFKNPPVLIGAEPTVKINLRFKEAEFFQCELPPEIDFRSEICFCLPSGEEKLCDAMSEMISKMKRNGMIARLIKAHPDLLENGFLPTVDVVPTVYVVQ